MVQTIHHPSNRDHTSLNQNQLDEIVSAILSGKYSWACFLLLRSVGYNPLDYIPYRTYNRLIKDNLQVGKSNQTNVRPLESDTARKSALSKITDLDHLDTIPQRMMGTKGGFSVQYEERESLWRSHDNLSYHPLSQTSPGFLVELKVHPSQSFKHKSSF